ncbi:MAG: transporter [Chitinophagaceae bacterium]|nr:transporter [Chitinophagaceae bacterium]
MTELWGATNIGKRFRLAVFIPYNFIERTNQKENARTNGIGDMSAIGYYQAFNKESVIKNKTLSQTLWLGGGIKAPTGTYNPEEKNIGQSSLNTFQLGTGSLDFSLNAMYDIRLQNVGVNVNSSYKINTSNKYDYQYGNKFTLNMLGYYRFTVNDKLAITPNTGVLFETASKDWKTKDIQVWETGGRSLIGTIGAELNFGRVSIGANFQTPLSQNLGEKKVESKNRGMAHISYSF